MNSTPAPEPPPLMGSLETNQEGCWGTEALSLWSPGREASSQLGSKAMPPGRLLLWTRILAAWPPPPPGAGSPGASSSLPRPRGAVSLCNSPLGVY